VRQDLADHEQIFDALVRLSAIIRDASSSSGRPSRAPTSTADARHFNQVLSSKRGIPITLALVYLSVVQKLISDTQFLEDQHLNAWGVKFLGHFLVAVSDAQGEHLIDPFKGCLVTREECYSIIANLYGRHHAPDDRYFERADSRQLLRRILENLKAINLQKGYASHAIVYLTIKSAEPHAPSSTAWR
jgi:regulator of sirC expression with transglutaminase-like and TPR domain